MPCCRSLRLGYNVLLLDTDVAVFDDPYKYFKQPPFQDIVVLNQEESSVEANGGNLYVQVQHSVQQQACSTLQDMCITININVLCRMLPQMARQPSCLQK